MPEATPRPGAVLVRTACGGRGLQYLPLVSDVGWADYDGRTVVVTLRDGTDRWRGTGTLHYEASDGSPCDCGGLSPRSPSPP